MKKRMFLSTILMTLVLLMAVVTATFAWYTASTDSVSAGSVTDHAMSTNKSVSVGAITIDMTVSAEAVKLSATDGTTKAWSQDGTYLISENIAVGDLAQYYSAVTVTVTKIYLTEDDSKTALNAEALKAYAGTYNFKVTADGQAKLADAAPTTVEELNAFNATEMAFTLTIKADGTYLNDAASNVFVVMRGDDLIKNGYEAGSLSVVVAA